MVHEVPDQKAFFNEIKTIVKLNGQVLVVEPTFHVSKKAFEETVKTAQSTGFTAIERPKVFFSKAVILKKANE